MKISETSSSIPSIIRLKGTEEEHNNELHVINVTQRYQWGTKSIVKPIVKHIRANIKKYKQYEIVYTGDDLSNYNEFFLIMYATRKLGVNAGFAVYNNSNIDRDISIANTLNSYLYVDIDTNSLSDWMNMLQVYITAGIPFILRFPLNSKHIIDLFFELYASIKDVVKYFVINQSTTQSTTEHKYFFDKYDLLTDKSKIAFDIKFNQIMVEQNIDMNLYYVVKVGKVIDFTQ